MLVVPLVNHENDVIGVIQLINKGIKRKNSIYTFMMKNKKSSIFTSCYGFKQILF